MTTPSPTLTALLLALALLLSPPSPRSRADAQRMVNPVSKPIVNGKLVADVRKFAQMPLIKGNVAKITGMTSLGNNLYVVSSVDGIIFRVPPSGVPTIWFNATRGFARGAGGRKLNVESRLFGGIRGIAFHPSFGRTGLFYLSALEDRPRFEGRHKYISKPPASGRRATADSVVVEFRFKKAMGKVDDLSYREVFRVGLPRLDHPIRQIIFMGKFLVIGHGDGSHGYDSFSPIEVVGGGQNNDALGKILRINPLKAGSKPYSIPFSNPFIRSPKFKPEVYAVGVRNPHTLCYSRRWGLFVGDVGRDNVEEVNRVVSGGNYGWAKREGTFVHLQKGGTGLGVGVLKLPANDATFGFTYPAAQVGHRAAPGAKSTGQAIAGACPVENGSAMNGVFLYTNFPTNGHIYYSFTAALKSAVTKGPPGRLTQATTFKAVIKWDHDGKPGTPSKWVLNFLSILRKDMRKPMLDRSDLRFGRGPRGQIFVSSKQSGAVYLIKTTMP